MRAFCTVSAPLEVCAPPSRPLPPGARFLALRLLGTPQPRTLYFLVEAKSRVREVYAQTCHHFSKQGMLDTELFGLAVLIDGEYLFTDPESKLSKYGPKSWRSSHTHGLDANGKPLLELHFRVQFYIESPLMLRDEITRHNYYMQLKSNTILRDIKDVPDQTLLMLSGLAIQADMGDCVDNETRDYIKADEYLATHLRSNWGVAALHSIHRDNRGMSRADAETHFIREACNLEAINTHMFRMRSSKNENGTGSVQLCIYAKGVKILAEGQSVTPFLWSNIVKLSFNKKKFEIRSGENNITLYSASDDKSKILLALCRETHQFSMKIAPRLTEAIKREEEESNCMHACYLYSRALNLPYKSKSDQRISVISSTSSNTTSGIVSDRVHSEDELEILINGQSAIAAPSTESLALAHLLDCPSISRQTSSVGQVSLKDLEDTFASLKQPTEEKKEDPDSPAHNIGSQCSSTCSTIVVATDTINLPALTTTQRRQSSATSSLELGYSHTAQNSAISEGTNLAGDDNAVYDAPTASAPTETSGVYTMTNSSEIQSSEIADSESHESSNYGSFAPKDMMVDTVDGDFRLRSDSNISSTSFRGDGSDPADRHTLLSAEELTDLIVGRGTYPSRKTVSHTLDSDCDYVTLPLPMEGESYLQGSEDTAPTEEEYDTEMMMSPPTPPKRIDSNPERSLSNIVPACSPPPYNAYHEKTGLRGPDLPLPPPPPPPISSRMPEEANARFITTKPQINILKAHASVVSDSAVKPSYATPNIPPPIPAPKSALSTPNISLSAATTIGIPIVPYNVPQSYRQPPASRSCVLLPILKSRRRQPPPPPQLATVYTQQLARSQIELYQQQLYSDVDYVIYPIQDPAISQQEYLDAKQGSILAAMATQSPQPPPYFAYHTVRTAANRSWDACKNHAIYRSTPYLSMALSSTGPSRYASTQNLSDTYVQLQSAYSTLYSPSMQSLCSSYDVPPPPPLRPRPSAASFYVRSKSDENLLGDAMNTRRMPPPPPQYERRTYRKPALPTPVDDIPPAVPAKPARLKSATSTLSSTKSSVRHSAVTAAFNNMTLSHTAASAAAAAPPQPASAIDIHTLREKSKNLDLPLISALCNDQSLLKQTRAFVMPKHPKMGVSQVGFGPKGKYPVSGLSTTQFNKRKASIISHRHPNDKLPPLPASIGHPMTTTQKTAAGNNYVMDPTPTPTKHKSLNLQQPTS